MRRVLALVLAGALALTACGSAPTLDQQVNDLVRELGGKGLTIDQVKEANGSVRNNAHWEAEQDSKKRKVTTKDKKGKVTTKVTEVKRDTKVAEVTVVVLGNCKAQIERVLDAGSTSYYFDETWTESGIEVPIEEESGFSFMPTKTALEQYFTSGPHAQDFAFCRGKDTKPSPPGRD